MAPAKAELEVGDSDVQCCCGTHKSFRTLEAAKRWLHGHFNNCDPQTFEPSGVATIAIRIKARRHTQP